MRRSHNAKRQAKWRAAHPEYRNRQKDIQLRRRYGIGLDEYRRLLEQQAGVCAICGEACRTGRNLAVDHNHTTGAVRGLLCSECNTAIGKLRDDPVISLRAAAYLLEHKDK